MSRQQSDVPLALNEVRRRPRRLEAIHIRVRTPPPGHNAPPTPRPRRGPGALTRSTGRISRPIRISNMRQQLRQVLRLRIPERKVRLQGSPRRLSRGRGHLPVLPLPTGSPQGQRRLLHAREERL